MGNKYSHVPLVDLTSQQLYDLVNEGSAYANIAQTILATKFDGKVLSTLTPDKTDELLLALGLENLGLRFVLTAKVNHFLENQPRQNQTNSSSGVTGNNGSSSSSSSSNTGSACAAAAEEVSMKKEDSSSSSNTGGSAAAAATTKKGDRSSSSSSSNTGGAAAGTGAFSVSLITPKPPKARVPVPPAGKGFRRGPWKGGKSDKER